MMAVEKSGEPLDDNFFIFSLVVLVVIVLGTALSILLLISTQLTSVCTAESKVVDIVSVNYRDATIKLENGQLVTVNQATLKKGDAYCLSYQRK
jgi:hypothetical protein